MPPKKSPVRRTIYQLKVTLKHVKPAVWRRIQAPADIHLDDLHQALQVVMGWHDGHLHLFRAGEVEYAIPYPEEDAFFDDQDETKTKLSEVVRAEKQKLVYEYDFGDGWRHEILVEKILPREEGKQYPVCLAGKRACPPEDCGGPRGYAEFLQAIRDPAHPDHDDMLEWIGGEFDPEAFDLEEVNGLLTP